MNTLNRCTRCKHEWQDSPAGFAIQQACPKCGSVYWEWTNYESDREPAPGPRRVSFIRRETR